MYLAERLENVLVQRKVKVQEECVRFILQPLFHGIIKRLDLRQGPLIHVDRHARVCVAREHQHDDVRVLRVDRSDLLLQVCLGDLDRVHLVDVCSLEACLPDAARLRALAVVDPVREQDDVGVAEGPRHGGDRQQWDTARPCWVARPGVDATDVVAGDLVVAVAVAILGGLVREAPRGPAHHAKPRRDEPLPARGILTDRRL
mmetsp:Transcript_39866/g.101305  ORF Transcript_39866/g.101305 Transcript_39866/m.101305 type:complete len:202 (+) Transcript_39866:607-1212(+)